MTPAVAQEHEPIDVKQLLSSSNPSISDLAGAIAAIEDQIAQAEATIGTRREAVNRALVDLQDARTQAEQARRGTETARGELDAAQDSVTEAQEKMNEISRSAYRRSANSDSVSALSGREARAEKLERQAMLRTRSTQQQGVIDELQKQRTEKANKESQLRKTQQLAEEREARADEAERSAREQLAQSQTDVESASKEREDLLSQLSSLTKALNQAKGLDTEEKGGNPADANVKPNALTDQQAVEANTGQGAPAQDPASTVEVPAEAATGVAPEAAENVAPEASAEHNGAAAEAPAGQAPATVAEAQAPAQDPAQAEEVTRQYQAEGSPQVSASDVKNVIDGAVKLSSDPNVQELSSRGFEGGSSSIDMDTIALGAGAIGAAVAIIAASEPNHTGLTKDELNSLAQGSSRLAALQGGGSGASDGVDSEVGGVLEDLGTTDSVTDEATGALGDASREAKIEAVIARAKSQIGVPYAWGGGNANGPTKGIRDGGVADSYGDYNKVGFDCSGLTLYAYAAAGISLPHYTGYQYQKGTKVSPSEMQRGDLIFYGPNAEQHVAIYLGDGTMIEAPQSGSTVQISPVRWAGMSPYAVRLL
ncbi:MAG: NlpC/P60 family protein [Corynebacterium sp.]|nr:NlpC/P60 family protein [Corynebacterium sp.]MDO5031566.1 NlpC/P60 family protein [Corynebacterium sp.]